MSGANISTRPLVLPLQAACSGTTRCLYADYKVLVVALQDAVYCRYKPFVVPVRRAFCSSLIAVALVCWWQSGVGKQISSTNSF